MVKIMVVGLGYVGLPISISFAKKFETYGFDINKEKINKYKNGIDITKTVVKRELEKTKLNFTTNEKDINKADYIIVTVPTPINENNEPDLKYIVNASEMIARNIKKGATVVYESTVYPGTTEEICVPIIEKIAKMKLNIDFFVGYSPERINPGDSFYKFENIAKIVSGSTESVTENIANLYAKCIKSQIVKVSSIKVAEASKIIENTQRDINIAFINEISKILHCMNIDTQEVLNAASTKWNFLNFKPGLVGGHCISVDPYYLASKAKEMNFNAKVILTARSVNDSMAEYIAENLKQELLKNNIELEKAKVLIKGLTFKENIPDIRNSKVIDMVNILKENGVNVFIEDYNVDNEKLEKMYHLSLDNEIPKVDAVVFAVKHEKYSNLEMKDIENLYEEGNTNKIIFDLHSIFEKEKLIERGFKVWRL